jgi:hypothetical protein
MKAIRAAREFTRSRGAPVETGHGNCATTRETLLPNSSENKG